MSARATDVVFFGREGAGSFNESGLAGARAAQAKGHAVNIHWIADPQARNDALARIAESRPELVIAHGGQGNLPVQSVAADFPETRFVVTQGDYLAPNVASYEVLQEQSAFLAGVLAARLSRSQVVGHLSGEKVPPGLKGRAAFHAGYEAAGGQRFVTAFCGDQHDPELGYRYGRSLIEAGADVIFAMLDGGRPGLIQACREAGIKQIGNVLDWTAREGAVFAASAMADSGQLIDIAIGDHAAGNLRLNHKVCFGLERPDLVRLQLHAELQAALGPELETWRERILAHPQQVRTAYAGPELQSHPLPAV